MSGTSIAPAASHAGRRPRKASSITHWLNGSPTTVASSRAPISRLARVAVGRRGGRHDAVDHGRGEVGVGGDPVRERRRPAAPRDEPAQHLAVAAGGCRRRRSPAACRPRPRGAPPARARASPPAPRSRLVPRLGDRERDDVGPRRRQPVAQRVRPLGGHERLAHDAHHAHAILLGPALEHAVEPVLLVQRVDHRRGCGGSPRRCPTGPAPPPARPRCRGPGARGGTRPGRGGRCRPPGPAGRPAAPRPRRGPGGRASPAHRELTRLGRDDRRPGPGRSPPCRRPSSRRE